MAEDVDRDALLEKRLQQQAAAFDPTEERTEGSQNIRQEDVDVNDSRGCEYDADNTVGDIKKKDTPEIGTERTETTDRVGGESRSNNCDLIPLSVGAAWGESNSTTVSDGDSAGGSGTLDNTGTLEIHEEISDISVTATVTEVEKARSLHRSLFSRGERMQDVVFEAAAELVEQADRDPIRFFELLDRSADADRRPAIGGGFDAMMRKLFDPRSFHEESDGQVESDLRDFMAQIGGGSFHKLPVGMVDAYQGPLKILRASTLTPTVVVQLSHELFQKDRSTVDKVVEYVTELSRGCKVLVVADRAVQQRLVADYADILPTSVIETTNAQWDTERESDDPEATAKSIIPVEIKPTDTAAVILQIIGEGATWQAKYGKHSSLANDSRVTVGHSMIRKSVKTLKDHGLINTHGDKDPYAVLTQAGRAAIDRLQEKYGKQSQLDHSQKWRGEQCVTQTLNANSDTCSHEQGREGGMEGNIPTNSSDTSPNPSGTAAAEACTQPDHARNHTEGLTTDRRLDDWSHHAEMATVDDGCVHLVNTPSSSVNRSDQWSERHDYRFDEWTLTELEDNRGYIYSNPSDRDEAVFGGEFHTPLQLSATLARSMVNPQALNELLTPERLDGHGDELDALLDGEKPVLRDETCLGWLKDGYDGEDYVEALEHGRKALEQLLRDHKNSDPGADGFSDLCRDIMQLSHGIIGTATAIYDLLDIDIHRTIRIPGSVSRHLDRGVNPGESHTSASVTGLCQWFLRAATIASKMGTYTQSRVQFEPREDKRQSISDPPDVTTDNPKGYHIGSWSIVGHGVESIQDDLQYTIEHPEEYNLTPQTDAENYVGWVVDIPIKTGFDRHTAYRATSRMLEARNLRPTRHAVSLLHAFCGTPHDVTKALAQLSSEDGRRVRADEIKFALSHLPPNRILPSPGNTSTKSKAVHALLTADEPLTQKELCDRADISENSFAGWGDKTSHRDELEAFGLIHETAEGWIIALPYDPDLDISSTPEEDPNTPATGLPWYAIVDAEASHLDRKHQSGHREESLQGVLYEAILELEATDEIDNLDHPVCGKLYGSLTADDLREIMDHRQSWSLLIEFATAIREGDPTAIGTPDKEQNKIKIQSHAATATLGQPPDQQGVRSYTDSNQPVSAD